ncbi:hypothetical protein AYO38_09215 [bacterium SCGC AG-212-C10]|nr:hypothetical protein AYO38_09215 [bacterium SCGC AG-212-C10]
MSDNDVRTPIIQTATAVVDMLEKLGKTLPPHELKQHQEACARLRHAKSSIHVWLHQLVALMPSRVFSS